jgi:hypothetical protein
MEGAMGVDNNERRVLYVGDGTLVMSGPAVQSTEMRRRKWSNFEHSSTCTETRAWAEDMADCGLALRGQHTRGADDTQLR